MRTQRLESREGRVVWLGIDLGTSAVKAVVIDERGSVVGRGGAPLEVSRPHPNWSEQAPDDWWNATRAAVLGIDARVRRRVRGIGLSGQMHGATLLNSDGAPLRPAILWNDGRSEAECAELEARCLNLSAIAGNLAMPGFTAPKLMWVRNHEPEIFARVHKVLLPKDYLRFQMTGVFASDMSDSAGTLWLDVAKRTWSEEILAACELGVKHMPTLHEGPETTALLSSEVASAWGMEAVPVVAGGGDNAAGAIGAGVARDGEALLSLGTSGVIFVANDTFRPNPARAVHAFCHCLPATWHQMSVHLSAASCVDWVMRLVGLTSPADVFARAEAVGPNSGPELFLPYLSGERTPHNDPNVRGGFLYLDHDTNTDKLCEAVLEGVAFALADGLEALREGGARVPQLSVIGGGARSQYWGRLIAAVLDVTLLYREDGEVGPALGAARLAQLGARPGSMDDICAPPAISTIIEPDAALRARLAAKRQSFREAYGRVRVSGGRS